MSLTDSPIQISLVTACALLMAWIGVLAALRRGPLLTTVLFSAAFLSMAAVEAGVIGLLHADTPGGGRMWATYLAGVSALASWLWLSMSVVLARPDPWAQIRSAGAYLTLALAGCLVMFRVSDSPFIVKEVQGLGPAAVIVLAGMGKVYLMYLVVVMVAVLMNLERMLRTSPASAQKRLRPMFLAFLFAILTQLLVVSGGLLYGGVRASWMAACAVPMFGAGVVTALSLARRRLSDMSVPLARPVIYYSSVSLTLAGAFLLTMAVLSKVLPVLTPEWKRLVSVVFYLLVGGGGLVLALSPRVARSVKRFVDRNFYANRYDYRREWERVTNAITPTASLEEMCRQIEQLLCGVFEAERVAIYVADERQGGFRRVHGPAGMPALIAADNPLPVAFQSSRAPLLLEELASDLDLLPIAVENRVAIQALHAAVCGPLAVGDRVIGLLWLSAKRTDEDYSLEDLEFLGAVSRQLAAALAFAQQAESLAETRQLESLHRLSSFVLHDIKNQVSGLSLVVDNARRHLASPEFQREAMGVVERAVQSLKSLMGQVASVGRPPEIHAETVEAPALVDDALAGAGLTRGGDHGIEVAVDCPPLELKVDRDHLKRVLTNLLVNAREALPAGRGEIRVAVRANGNGAPGDVTIDVSDNGRGMSEEFVRNGLFRPFATTKPEGLGVGLAQVRSIIEAHGGSITVESRLGEGTRFRVRLPGAAASPAGVS